MASARAGPAKEVTVSAQIGMAVRQTAPLTIRAHRSHPVLTLHTRHRRDDDLLLSTFLHEQLHWQDGAAIVLHRELDVTVAHPRAGIEPLGRRAEPVGTEAYETGDIVLPVSGTWSVRVDALVTDFERLTVTADVHLH